jgi:CheY-like chemotaxis protein
MSNVYTARAVMLGRPPRTLDSNCAGEPAHGGASSGSGPQTCSVLLVDDTPVIRYLAQDVLAEAGYDAHSAEDGVAALGFLRARESPIDVVITDLSMPLMDGFALIRELRQLSPTTRIVLMTGYVDAIELAERSDERPDLVLPKPFRPPELLDAVDAVLRASRT